MPLLVLIILYQAISNDMNGRQEMYPYILPSQGQYIIFCYQSWLFSFATVGDAFIRYIEAYLRVYSPIWP